MTLKMKIIQIGNSLGVTLPKEALAALKVEKGDVLMLTESPDGFRLTPFDPEIAKQIDAGRAVMRDYRDTLRALTR
jgi:putative addiction module antidote